MITNCAFCKKEIDTEKEFKDDLSKTEFEISKLCQECQDKVFRKELHTEKPGQIKPFDKEGRQNCLRCGKEFAVKGDVFCDKCIKERMQIDEGVREVNKIIEERNLKK